MQNIESYERGIHTSGQAARKLQHCCSVFGVRVGYRTLTSFEGGVVFVLALQINEMITTSLDGGDFNVARFAIIMLMILISILFSYTKEQFVAEYSDTLNDRERSSMRIHSSFAHTIHQ